MSRMLVIMALVFQPLLLGLLQDPTWRAEGAGMADAPRATVCGCGCQARSTSGCHDSARTDACLCQAAPNGPDSKPAAPTPRGDTSLLLLLLVAHQGVSLEIPARVESETQLAAAVVVPRSHNERRALLCVWRT
jgi:hypothetical protein